MSKIKLSPFFIILRIKDAYLSPTTNSVTEILHILYEGNEAITLFFMF
jgi:hypothetical protein